MLSRQIKSQPHSSTSNIPSSADCRHGNAIQPPVWTHALGSRPSLTLQPKLTINQSGAKYEQEAERVAGQVMRMPAPTVQRQPTANPTPAPTPSVRRTPFDDQPTELRTVLEDSFAAGKFGCLNGADAASCFNLLDNRSRFVLTSLYNRLSRFKLWGHVVYIAGLWVTGAGGAQFIVQDHLSLFKSLLNSTQFCVDTALGGMLHQGATSVREISTGDSLHISIASGNSVSAHIDAISPVAGQKTGSQCIYDPVRAQAHIGREAIPGVLKIPNLKIFPEPRQPTGLPERNEPASNDIIRFEFTF